MKKLIEYHLSDGGTIFIEGDGDSSVTGGKPVGLQSKLKESARETVDMFNSLTSFVNDFKSKVKQEIDDASEITVEFGVKIGADIGVIIAKSQVEANFKVTISWKK